MGKTTVRQREERREREHYQSLSLQDAAAVALKERQAQQRQDITRLVDSVLGRQVVGWDGAFQGGAPIALVEGLRFTLTIDRGGNKLLALVVSCSACDGPMRFSLESLAALGRYLAEHDRDGRCRFCVEHMREPRIPAPEVA